MVSQCYQNLKSLTKFFYLNHLKLLINIILSTLAFSVLIL